MPSSITRQLLSYCLSNHHPPTCSSIAILISHSPRSLGGFSVDRGVFPPISAPVGLGIDKAVFVTDQIGFRIQKEDRRKMDKGEGKSESIITLLEVNDPDVIGIDGLFQVMKAVEGAEITIKQQVEENNRLKAELQKRYEELERFKDIPDNTQALAAKDDPLPAIEGLQISGKAYPGQQLQACGYSINGTTSCNFEWVRHLEDGSVNYVGGAKQPSYFVSADDIDTFLAIEVQPLDDRKRKGDLVTVFANEHRKIVCEPEMRSCIEKTFYSGHASYNLSLSTGYLDKWEPATLIIKRDGYSIKSRGPSGVALSEKFSSSTVVSIAYGNPTDFSIIDSMGVERVLRVGTGLTDLTCARDTIVLTLRLFIFEFKLKDKRNKKLGLQDKISLSSWRCLLRNKYARTFAFVYAIGLHILLFTCLYKMLASSYL